MVSIVINEEGTETDLKQKFFDVLGQSQQTLLVKGQVISILGFASHPMFAPTLHFIQCSIRAVTEST